jgi:hypothetical protein
MDTVSTPVFPVARILRPVALLVTLAIVASSLLVLLGASLDAVVPADPPDQLLAPFRWTFRHAV